MAEMFTSNASHDEVLSQIDNLAFLSQTRIRVYDQSAQLLFDSGDPQNVNVNLGVTNQLVISGNSATPGGLSGVISVAPNGNLPFTLPNSQSPITAMPNGVFIYRSVQATGSPFGFSLSGGPGGGGRSNLVETLPITNPQNASVIGNVELSEGPAYGRAVLNSVAAGWAIASAIAILLAAGLGWFISRRFSAPVLALTDATARMAAGDLSSRAEIKSRDEFGQLARSFNTMAGQIETTVTTLRTFVSDAAHEINTPLTALKTNLELAVNEPDFSQKEEFIQRAIEQNDRLEHLANELLDLSRLEASQPVRNLELFDLHNLIMQITEYFASRAEQAGRKFNLVLPEREISILGSRQQIQRALEDLLENALKFTLPEGSITLNVQLKDVDVILAIADTGIGIAPEDLPHLFRRFHRGHNSTEYPGNGLGLAIVKAIVSLHNGSVDVESAGEGKGSQFSIRMPLAPNNSGIPVNSPIED
jgi:signal transduction histidine kinase